jgi:hypothetical protein
MLARHSQKILLIVAGIFFLVYAWPTITVTWPAMRAHGGYYISSWPDSMANYFFTGRLANNNSLSYDEPLNIFANDAVQPRSVNVFNHNIVPTGFVGFILIAGVLAKLLGLYAILLITPLLAVLAVLAFFGLVKRLYNERVAWLAALLLFTLPPFWYYASLPMLPNVLFLSLVIIAYYFYFKQAKACDYRGLVSGLLFGLALIIRPMEFVWLGVLMVAPLFFYREHFKIKRVLVFMAGVLLPIIILLAVNQKLYSNAFYTGYLNLEPTKGDSVITRLPPALRTNLSAWLAFPKLILAPFGLHPRLILHNLNAYWWQLLWPWCVLFIAALLIGWRRLKTDKLTRGLMVYWWTAVLAGVCLIIYYGSWLFDDQLTLRLNTIGISYVRYWLPLYVLVLPFIAYGLEQVTQRNPLGFVFSKILGMTAHTPSKTKLVGLVLVFVLLLGFSWWTVYLKSGDGLRDQAQVTRDSYQLLDEVKAQVNKEAVIVCDREDKILFPAYSVVVFNNNYLVWPGVKNIVGKRPVYYLTRASDVEINALNERLKEFKINLKMFSKVNEEFTLYSLK